MLTDAEVERIARLARLQLTDSEKVSQVSDILKIDCEGAEFEILYNLPQEYFKRIEKIRLEYHNHLSDKKNNSEYLMEFLKKNGFKVTKNKKCSDYNGDLWFEKL